MALCTLNEVKEYNDITDDTNDALLENLINRVSEEIENYCDRKFESQSYTDYFDGNNYNLLFITQYPVITASGVEVWDDCDWVWGDDTLISGTNYTVIDNRYVLLKNTSFVDGSKNVKINYVAGYDSIPTDLTQFTIEEVIRKFKARRNPGDIKSKALPDGSVTYKDASYLSDASVLDTYKRRWIF